MIRDPQPFPPFLRALPQADLPFDGLQGWLLQSGSGQVLFNESAVEVQVPEHAHGDQWGVVLAGQIDLTVDGQTRGYLPGDTYFIPAGVPHAARLHPGFRAVDCFAEPHRHRVSGA